MRVPERVAEEDGAADSVAEPLAVALSVCVWEELDVLVPELEIVSLEVRDNEGLAVALRVAEVLEVLVRV